MGKQKNLPFVIAILCCGVLMMQLFWQTGLQLFSREQQTVDSRTVQRIPVLMYHHLLPQEDCVGIFADNNIVVSVEQFRADLEQLKAMGYETISLRQLNRFVRREEALHGRYVVITFDDGYLSNRYYAQPILEELGYTAVIFALTGYLEQSPQTFQKEGLQYLSWPEIRQMGQTFQFASHTDNLHQLTYRGRGKLTTLSAREIAEDLQRSQRKLKGTDWFAYPYGHSSDTARQVLEQQGIQLAFTVSPVSVQAGDDPLALGRWDMYQYRVEDIVSPDGFVLQ